MLNSATIFLIILAMFTAYLIGAILIPYLKRLHFGQHERLEGPNSHLAKKVRQLSVASSSYCHSSALR